METQPVSTKHVVDTLGHTAPDRRNDDFFLALLNESRRQGEANAPKPDDRARPDPYRNKIDPDKDEFRTRDRDADRVERNSANDDREIEESRADTQPAEDRNADEPPTQQEESVEAPANREAAPEATDEPDAATTEASAETAEIANEATAETPAESTAAQTTQSETATADSGTAAPTQGAPANQASANQASAYQAVATGVTAAGETPGSDPAMPAAQGATSQAAAASNTAKVAATATDPTVTTAQAVATGQSAKTGGSKQPGEGNAAPNADSAATGAAIVNGNKGGRPAGTIGQAATTDSGTPSDGQGSDTAQQARANPSNSAAAQKSTANHPAALPANADSQGSAAAAGANGGTAPTLEQLLANAGKATKATAGGDGATQTNHTSSAGHVMQASARPAGAAAQAGAQASQPGQAVHIDDVAVHIYRAAAKGQDRINIRLNPAELGQIEVRLKLGADGVTRAVVHADRRETLDLLQRDARGLERALQDAGLKTDPNNLSFSLRDHGQGGLQHGDGQASGTPQFAESDSDARTAEEAPQVPPPSVSSNRALDIRV